MINNPGKIFERMEIGRLIDLNKERSIDVIIKGSPFFALVLIFIIFVPSAAM